MPADALQVDGMRQIVLLEVDVEAVGRVRECPGCPENYSIGFPTVCCYVNNCFDISLGY